MAAGDPEARGAQPGAAGGNERREDTVRLAFDVLGLAVTVDTTPGEPETAVRTVLRGFGPVATPGASDTVRATALSRNEGGRWEVRADGAVVLTTDALTGALGALEWQVVSAAVQRRFDLFHLHGSALCLPTACAGLLLVGGSGRGKTTLTMGLMLRGFVPFADDVVIIEPETLHLRALRRSFHVADETWNALEAFTGPLARDAGEPPGYFSPPQWAEHPVPVRWVLFPEYRAQQTPQLLPLSASEAATSLVAQTLTLASAPRTAVRTAARLTEQAQCYRFLCGDLSRSVALVQGLVASLPRPRTMSLPG